MPGLFDLMTSTVASSLRAFNGIQSEPALHKPVQMLELYDRENHPGCRLVREALTELDLDALILPCPQGGKRFAPDVETWYGKAQLPRLNDPNTGRELNDPLDIVEYLYHTYGGRPLPLKWRAALLQKLSSAAASAARRVEVADRQPAEIPEKKLELYSFDASPYARPVREQLCRMEMPYILRSCGRTRLDEWILPPVRQALGIVPQSELHNRKHLVEKEGKTSIPYLYDPNAEVGLFESQAILHYLDDNFGG